MPEPDCDALYAALPIFPLPRAVLMPGDMLPLHVFEPRYRALVAHCLAGDRHLGIATLRPAPQEGEGGASPIWPEVGVGRIVRHQALPDGRSNVLLAFVSAVRAEEEVATSELFRRVRARPLPRVADEGYAEGERLRLLAVQVAARVGPLGARTQLFELEGRPWVDAMARLFVQEVDARRAYLAASHASRRVAILEEALLTLLASNAEYAADA